MEKELIISLITVVGAILGSFTTMLIHRLHFDEDGIIAGRSRCPKCRKNLKFWNLIPILSWVFQRGKCSNCKEKIPFSYPIIELTFLLTFFFFAQKFYGQVELIPLLIVVFFSLVLFYYDLLFYEVDDRIIFPAIFLAVIWAFFREIPWYAFLLGASVGFAFYAFQYYASKGRWVGAGDMRLGFFMGIVLGVEKLLFALLVAYAVGSLVAILLILFKKFTRKSILPMGAFLMPSTILFLYVGVEIINLYWEILVSI
ncbi:prepilin peptidase [Candidatus Gracilibacteria bacterium]|nr:prepilin peptidase [Candidatus Gracilibacteria bacterium]